MKRLLCVCLLLTLLLSGCAEGTVERTHAATAVPASETLPGGILVQTDYSAYTPRVQPQASVTRLQEAWMDALQPASDYGRLYPYVGGWLFTSSEEGYAYREGATYGLMDENGRIVTDAVYSIVYQPQDDTQTLPVLVFGRTKKSEPGKEPVRRYGFATLDGSFVTDCVYSDISVQDGLLMASSFQYLSDEEGYRTAFTLYRTDGSVVCKSADLPFAERLCQTNYADGILTVALTGGKTDEWGDAMLEYYYTDMDGVLLSGPYDYAQAFSDGYGLVQNGRLYSFVDRSGTRLGGESYTSAEPFVNAVTAVVSEDDSEGYVLSNKGERLATVTKDAADSYFYCYRDGEYLYFATNSGGHYYAEDGTEITMPDNSGQWYIDGQSQSKFLAKYTDNGLMMRNIETGKELALPASCYTNSVDEGTRCCLYAVQYFETDNHTKLTAYDSDFETLFQMEDSYLEVVRGGNTDESYLLAYSAYQTVVYDADLKPLFTLPYSSSDEVRVFGDRLVCANDFGCAHYDFTGSLLYYYPQLNGAD